MRRYSAHLSVFLALVVLAVAIRAGPLDPPAGPISPIYKTLTEVEPRVAISAANTPGDADSLYKITQPGSYYLTGNITGVVGRSGIEIAASGVTLDLNGFDLVGVAGSLDGVVVMGASLTNIAVVNGSIRNWAGDGVDFITAASTNGRVQGVMASGNAGNGISLGLGCAATNCTVRSNTQHGLFVSGGATITACTASGNNGNGINVGTACTITACTLYQNSTGISTGAGCTITNSTVYDNRTHGISVTSGCLIAECSARSDAFDGILGGSDNVIRDNTCDLNGSTGDGAGIHTTGLENRIAGNNCTEADRGIDVDGSRNIIIKNTCSGNTTNWTIAVGNSVAPIVSTTINGVAISGNTFAGGLGSTDPNANFTY